MHLATRRSAPTAASRSCRASAPRPWASSSIVCLQRVVHTPSIILLCALRLYHHVYLVPVTPGRRSTYALSDASRSQATTSGAATAALRCPSSSSGAAGPSVRPITTSVTVATAAPACRPSPPHAACAHSIRTGTHTASAARVRLTLVANTHGPRAYSPHPGCSVEIGTGAFYPDNGRPRCASCGPR